MAVKIVPTGIPHKPKEYICLTADLVNGKPNISGADVGSTCSVLDGEQPCFTSDGDTWYTS